MTSQLYLLLNWISLTHEAEHSRCSVAHRQRFDMYVLDISVSSINNIWNTCLDVFFHFSYFMHCDSYFVWIVQYLKMESCVTLALTTICYVKVIVLLKVVLLKYYSAQCVLCSVCMFYGPVVSTKRRRGGYRGIFGEEGVDTGAYLGGKSRN